MPKKSNPKKMAAQQFGKIKALQDATRGGKYQVVKVDKAIGFCQFFGMLDEDRQLRKVTVLVRGKNKGGKNCATRVAPGCYVLVEGDTSKTLEVVGVVNQQEEVEALRDSGRLSDRLRNYVVEGVSGGAGTSDELDDLFDRSGGEAAELAGDAWGKRDEEREAQAAELLLRYQKKREGGAGKTLENNLLRETVADEDLAEEEADEEEGAAGGGGAGGKPRKSRAALNRAERRAAEAAARAAAEALAREQAEVVAYYREGARLDQEEEALLRRPVPARWDDDEVDIDAI